MNRYVVLSQDIHNKWFIAKETDDLKDAELAYDIARTYNKKPLIVDTAHGQLIV